MQSETAIETFIDLLKQGKSVIHTAEGYSMFPMLRPGDRVLIKPLKEGEIPETGSVVVLLNGATALGRYGTTEQWLNRRQASGIRHQEDKYGLVLHRLVEVRKEIEGEKLFITRGESMKEQDLPWQEEQLIGVVDSFTRNNRQQILKKKILSDREYRVNQLLLWMWAKFQKLKDITILN